MTIALVVVPLGVVALVALVCTGVAVATDGYGRVPRR